jgi:glutamate synthase (NADPH/NADH) small chain
MEPLGKSPANWSDKILADCIGEELPPCQAACPLDIRVREKLRCMQAGDLAGALAVVLERCPFPGILGRICPHPCEAACTRAGVDQPIAIAGLKRYLADLDPDAVFNVTPGPQRPQRLAVVGGGPAGLIATYELRRHGYPVTLFEAEAALGGALRFSTPPSRLPREVLDREVSVVENLGVDVRLRTRLGRDIHLENLRRDFVAVFLALGHRGRRRRNAGEDLTGAMDGLSFLKAGNPGAASTRVETDPVTLQTKSPGVFAGGALVTGPTSVVAAMAAGRRAALAMHCSFTGEQPQGWPPLGSRSTNLIVDTRGVTLAARQAMPTLSQAAREAQPDAERKTGFTPDAARAEAARCLTCVCSQCVQNCPFLQHYVQQFPYTEKELVRLLGDRGLTDPLTAYSCHYCGLCQAVCPKDLHAGGTCLATREALVARGQGPLPPHKGIQNYVKWGSSSTFALSRPDPATGKAARVFFPGCSLAGHFTGVVKAAYAYLHRQLPDTGIMLNCCGAPSYFMGEKVVMLRVIGQLRAELDRLGAQEVIVACPHCHMTFLEFLPEVKTRSLYEVLSEAGLPAEAASTAPGIFNVQDACGARQAPQIHAAVRQLVCDLGHAIEEMPHNRERSICCGSGGMVPAVAPELAKKMTDFRLSEATRDLVTYCASCRARLAKAGHPTLHVLDLLFNPRWRRTKSEPPPHSLLRWWRRWRLKRHLGKL